MPELPEVEAARRAVELHCKGLICRASVADDTTVIEGMAPFDMQRRLVAKRIVAAHRKGKQLWLELDEPPSICFQFGMAGAVYVKGVKSTKYVRSAVKDEDEWPSKYSKVHLVLDTGVEMSFTDKRRFARVRLLQDPRLSPPISELGPDAYTELPDETTFADSVAKKKTAIKAVLLDQSFIAGIGNWIADEVLYQSRIHPEQPASTLTAIDCERLRGAIKEGKRSSSSLLAEGRLLMCRSCRSTMGFQRRRRHRGRNLSRGKWTTRTKWKKRRKPRQRRRLSPGRKNPWTTTGNLMVMTNQRGKGVQ
ncbi:formamidopyrimidine-DNA glycosylase isoform X5 [Selaginella moellendorffii]|uniref:formamidopyrimidine-DNA glycosylase isoform X5 n=1 Tax=Selaginella moellendorffii TaxID=88036 RepID=UPI000D1C24B1|nr:formamidopyrimidine-DNA glycosylase isoform X5 [Selaginella moellendorffii]|eukprot:XP_024540788.1 formamidopyrimidine-DNA glycosylase isoform X5 [Selaginella moellendorffii]